MHGVKRVVEDVSEDVQRQHEAIEAKQIADYQEMLERLLSLRQGPNPPIPEIIECADKLLLCNPDFMTAWNTRRTAIIRVLAKGSSADAERCLAHEMAFGVEAIRANPKSYGAWYHRRWLVTKMRELQLPFEVSYELKLCDRLLELDARNFHCWNYRLFLAETFAVSIQAEFDFTTLMIYRNFSNYSAWHRRSRLFPQLEALVGLEGLRSSIEADLKLIKAAYFTEPADQSCWFYLRWLVDFAVQRFGDPEEELVKRELASISELLAIEPEAPLALSAWIDLARRLSAIPAEQIRTRTLLLRKCDPLRTEMYHDLLSSLAQDPSPN